MTANYEYMPLAKQDPDVEYPLTVKYCGECTMPLEYCEFSLFPDKCRAWLEKNLPEEFEQLTTDGAESNQTEAVHKGRQVRGGKGTIKKPAKQKIIVSKTSRGKKKYTTSVSGLSTFGIDLKVAAKLFGRKFATGSSVTGNDDEIVVQGDVKEELIETLIEKWPEIDENLIEDHGEVKR
ncbi:unnamed protein product [Heterobilharzia americana]|nr:unnamed protein product [Heterobilharzia americana]CAH8659688.1 unnamed protein product [Heterobilharzia americana]